MGIFGTQRLLQSMATEYYKTTFPFISDPECLEDVKRYREGVEEVVNRLLGKSLVKLVGNVPGDSVCRRGECNLGNLITDAMVWNYVTEFDDKVWNNVSIGVQNAGAIRGTIGRGKSCV